MKIILFFLLLINCNDNNLSHLGMNVKNVPIKDLSILIPNRFKERITRWYKDRAPAVIRTYDIMNNELIKELRYFNTGVLKHEAIYSKGGLESNNSVIWWHSNSNRSSQLIIDDSFKMIQGNIWYDNGQIRFHFEDNNYYWWDRNGIIEYKGNLNDTTFVLPVWSNNGRFIGIRKLISQSMPLWIEGWTLFNNKYRPLIKGNEIRLWSIILAIILIIISLIVPKLLKPLNLIWFKFGNFMGKLLSPIFMMLLYIITILPTGTIIRLFQRDLLKQKIDKSCPSYWIDRKEKIQPMKNQF